MTIKIRLCIIYIDLYLNQFNFKEKIFMKLADILNMLKPLFDKVFAYFGLDFEFPTFPLFSLDGMLGGDDAEATEPQT